MYGHEGAARDLTTRLTDRLPIRIASIRTEKGATAEQLPMPTRVRPHFVTYIDVDRYPFFCVTELDTPVGMTGARGMDNGVPYSVFTYRYPFRIYVYVKGVTYGDVELQLKRYLTAIREVLLEDRVLTDNNVASVYMESDTISENFFPPDETARPILGAGFVGVVLNSTEILNPPGVVIPVEGPVAVPTGPYTIRGDLGVQEPDTDAGVGHQPIGQWTTSDGNGPGEEWDPNDLP